MTHLSWNIRHLWNPTTETSRKNKMLDRHCPCLSGPIDRNLPRSCLLVEAGTSYRGGQPNIEVEGRRIRLEPVTQLRTIRENTRQMN